jgi:hypothetical protein
VLLTAVVALPAAQADDAYNSPRNQVLRAASKGSAALKAVLATGISVNATDNDRETALMEAADRGNLNAVLNLIVAGADVNAHNEDGETALMIAADDGHTAIVPALIAAGADRLNAVGKVITDSRWSFAANLPASVAGQLRVGGSALLRFTGEFEQDVEMRLDSLSAPQGEMVCAVFSTDRYLGQTTLLRFQSAELVFNTYSGLRVPKQALRMEKYTTTDEQTGEVTEHQMLGVYILIAGRAEFKQVSVITESQDFYVVKSVNESAADALRSGDEVIVRAVGLYDGKLMDM